MQGEVSGQMDEHLERIAEETRWWLDTANGLKIATDRLSSLNDAQSRNLREAQRDLRKRRKDSSLGFQAEAKQIPLLKQQTFAMVCDEEEPRKSEEAPSVNQMIPIEEERWLEMLHQIERNEGEITSLEYQLRSENLFGRELSRFVARAVDILTLDVRSSLEVTYDGPPAEKRTLSELRGLLREATQYIYDNKNDRSVL